MANTGIITNIQSYSLHDGPGTRTLIFFKGCPLRCRWCSNPETQQAGRELYYSAVHCIGCGICTASCPRGALSKSEDGIRIHRSQCVGCGTCVESCPTTAMRFSGREVTAEELLAEVDRERLYIEASGGGVTFSGGEPLLQAAFLEKTARLMKENGYHLAIESCFNVPWEQIARCLPYLDLLLVDLKCASPELHKELTGVDNRLILENIRNAYGQKPLIFRIPCIPGLNTEPAELERMAALIAEIDPKAPVNLMPYHMLGKSKYRNLGREYVLEDLEVPDDAFMQQVLSVFTEAGLNAEII